ncbi:putative carboxylesterase 18 [Apium graveolens]|uniref:putative carboxylesterase 18 n=1 Tax=Apium graveolens TaxID=4045 RepID=UPI003D7B421E
MPPKPLPYKTRAIIWMITTLNDAAIRRDGTTNRRFLDFINVKSPANSTPVRNVKTYDIKVDPSRNLWFRVFEPVQDAKDTQLPVIVFFHGGGFTILSPDSVTYDTVCRKFARKVGAVVVSVNYRLSPEHCYPAQFDDGFDVLKFLDADRKVLPECANVEWCFLAGDSAGGNLAHHVSKRACDAKFSQLKVIGVVAIQPFFGGQERTESEKMKSQIVINTKRTDWAWKAFMPKGDRDHEVINVSGPNAADITGIKDFPATLVFVGGLDILQDWQRRYYEWLKKSGKEAYLVEYPNMIHAFYVFPDFPESAMLISEVKDFVQKQIQKH